MTDRFLQNRGLFGWLPAGRFERRVFLAGAVTTGAFLFLGGRLWQLQFRMGEHFRELSENNRIRLKRVKALRGLIFDRDGEVLVENRPSFDVVMVPEDARDPKVVLERLEELLGEPLPEGRDGLSLNGSRPPFEAVTLKSDVDRATLVQVETNRLDLPGVSLRIGPRRSYLHGDVLAHVLGYMGEVSGRELEELESYRMGDEIGRSGLEKRWERHLRGQAGGNQVEVDAIGRELRVLREVPAVPGSSLFLTMDVDLQKVAYDALEGREGAVVAMVPETGAVLALVSRPSFDPNLFANGISAADWTQLSGDPLRPISDRSVQGQYPPGSVFKIVCATAALEEGIVNPFTRIFCGGALRYGKRDFRCWKKGGHGWVDLHRSLVESCDVYYYQVSQRLGVDTIAEYARRYGFGQSTGIALDHEKTGTIPDSKWKRSMFGEPWYPGETLSVAIGQGYVTSTPLQVATMMATVAAGGIRHRPHLVQKIHTVDGKWIEPEREGAVVETGVRDSTITQIREALRDVVQSPSGTGQRARVPGIEVAGKTGTSQTVRLRRDRKETGPVPREARDHAWFAAFAPVDAPEIAVAVLIEHAGEGGGRAAAPVAQRVLAHYLGVKTPEAGDGSGST